jgi:hypothetical protein
MSDTEPPHSLSDTDIARALTQVLIPAPGNWLPISAIHAAALAHLGVRAGAPYKAVKDVLRAAGVFVANHGADNCARGVALAPGVTAPDPQLEKKLRDMRRSIRRA